MENEIIISQIVFAINDTVHFDVVVLNLINIFNCYFIYFFSTDKHRYHISTILVSARLGREIKKIVNVYTSFTR